MLLLKSITSSLETTMMFENYGVVWAISDHLSSGHSKEKNKLRQHFPSEITHTNAS